MLNLAIKYAFEFSELRKSRLAYLTTTPLLTIVTKRLDLSKTVTKYSMNYSVSNGNVLKWKSTNKTGGKL